MQPSMAVLAGTRIKLMSTSIEKQSLEVHVEMCEDRFSLVHQELETLKRGQDALHARLDKVDDGVSTIHDTLKEKEHGAMKALFKVAVSIICVLIGALSFVVWYVITTGA
jgi:hypothetical protein